MKNTEERYKYSEVSTIAGILLFCIFQQGMDMLWFLLGMLSEIQERKFW